MSDSLNFHASKEIVIYAQVMNKPQLCENKLLSLIYVSYAGHTIFSNMHLMYSAGCSAILKGLMSEDATNANIPFGSSKNVNKIKSL